jgi:hypothetical protein
MANEIKIPFNEMTSHIDRLNGKTEVLRPYAKTIWTDPSDRLSAMNADFTEKLEQSFEKMENNKKLDIMGEIDTFIAMARIISNSFKTADETISSNISKSLSGFNGNPSDWAKSKK